MEKDDIVLVGYDAWALEADGKSLFETTDESLAREHDLYEDGRPYKPVAMVVGAGRQLPGLETSLLQAEVGKRYELNLEAKEAYGERRADLVRTYSAREFRRSDVTPLEQGITKEGLVEAIVSGDIRGSVHIPISIGGKIGNIVLVTAGRVRVDFNHRLAGRRIKMDYTVTKRLEGQRERCEAILGMHYQKATPDEFNITLRGSTITLEVPPVCKYDPVWLVAKYAIIKDLMDYTTTGAIRVVEVHKKEEKKEEEEEESKKGKEEEEEKEETGAEAALEENKPKENKPKENKPKENKPKENKPKENKPKEKK